MASKISVTPADLSKVWAISKTSDTRQMTLRVPSEVFYHIQALEEMFPTRSRNEMISDLLTTALAQFVEGLPYSESKEVLGFDQDHEPVHECWGPQIEFPRIVARYRDAAKSASAQEIEESSKSGKPDLKVVEDQEKAA